MTATKRKPKKRACKDNPTKSSIIDTAIQKTVDNGCRLLSEYSAACSEAEGAVVNTILLADAAGEMFNKSVGDDATRAKCALLIIGAAVVAKSLQVKRGDK